MALAVLERQPTGIEGFDLIAGGGLLHGRSALVSGTAGSGKTVLALQFLAFGISTYDQGGVLVTCEETPSDLIANVASFGWDLQGMIDAGKLAIVDGTAEPGAEPVEAGDYDLSALMVRIEAAIRRVNAKRLAWDAIGALFPQFRDATRVRRELHRILSGLRILDITTLITIERTEEDGPVGRFGVEEFVADTVVLLRNRLDIEKRRRTVEILKLRGGSHQKGEFPFTIDGQTGVNVIPLSAIELVQRSSTVRVSSGVNKLDEMCGGGMFRDSISLVSGATGTGKTLIVSHFIKAAIEAGERAILIGAEESHEQMARNAKGWGVDFEGGEKAGTLKVICRYPEIMTLEDHLLQIKRDIDEFKPTRIAIDSLSAFERVASEKSFREFVIALTSHLKHLEVTGLFTNTTSLLLGGQSITEAHVSTITDSIILLRYVELLGRMRRGITVLKMRGTQHDTEIHEYSIDSKGMHIGEVFRGVNGILAGHPTHTYHEERRSLGRMFSDED